LKYPKNNLIEPSKSGTFRLALAPSIVNPRVNRLWLVPFGHPWAMSSDFDSIVTELRDIFLDLRESGIEVRGFKEDEDGLDSPDWIPGGRIDPDLYDLPRERIDLFVISADRKIAERFHKIASRAGALIPNRIRDAVYSMSPTTAFAWWMAAVFQFSTLEPEVSPGWSEERPQECGDFGIYWEDPIASSLSAIEAAGLVAPSPEKTALLIGEWSVPMSKTEFARRILQKTDARARDVDPIFDSFEKRKVGPNTWTFRLDTLPPATRQKLEGGKL
jgi:hypothetical protein